MRPGGSDINGNVLWIFKSDYRHPLGTSPIIGAYLTDCGVSWCNLLWLLYFYWNFYMTVLMEPCFSGKILSRLIFQKRTDQYLPSFVILNYTIDSGIFNQQHGSCRPDFLIILNRNSIASRSHQIVFSVHYYQWLIHVLAHNELDQY